MAEFTAAVESYDRFMGRYAAGLAPRFADAAGVRAGMRVVDVGCGPGALAVELAGRVGGDNVAAIDPAPQFAAACRARIPGADVREGVAESLPWDDGTFDAAMCSLVVAWMSDADQGIGEMARVTKPGGTVAAAMWDIPGGGLQMVSPAPLVCRGEKPVCLSLRPQGRGVVADYLLPLPWAIHGPHRPEPGRVRRTPLIPPQPDSAGSRSAPCRRMSRGLKTRRPHGYAVQLT